MHTIPFGYMTFYCKYYLKIYTHKNCTFTTLHKSSSHKECWQVGFLVTLTFKQKLKSHMCREMRFLSQNIGLNIEFLITLENDTVYRWNYAPLKVCLVIFPQIYNIYNPLPLHVFYALTSMYIWQVYMYINQRSSWFRACNTWMETKMR